MRNAFEVLRQKEGQLKRLQQEVDALRIAAPLLHDDEKSDVPDKGAYPITGTTVQPSVLGFPSPNIPGTQVTIQSSPTTAPAAAPTGWDTAAKRWP